MKLNHIYQGDCLEVMKGFPDNSIDTILTDPPYFLGFMGKAWDKTDNVQSFTRQWAKEALRVAKPGATLLSFGGTRTWHRLACGLEDAGWIIKDTLMWIYGSGFPKATDISKQIDKAKGAEREVIGSGKSGKTAIWQKDGGMGNYNITTPATPEAKLWNGWKSHGLKPAWEPIIMAMKPNEGSYANNALKWGVAGLNIDGGRIKTEDKLVRPPIQRTKNEAIFPLGKGTQIEPQGRFPANLIHDGSDEVVGLFPQTKSGGASLKSIRQEKYNSSSYEFGGKGKNDILPSEGSASRFFYCAKASKAERNRGCEELEEKIGGGMAGTADKTLKTGSGNERNNRMKNNHPTVKPLSLMKYLCTLTKTPTETGGIVLDPFAGSGTTGMACVEVGRPYILIEKEADYVKIAKARIKATVYQENILSQKREKK